MFRNMLVASLLVLAPLSTNAQELVFAEDPQIIAALVEDNGFPAEITVDNVGDPMILSAAHGYDFQILFYDCIDNIDCQALQFSASFDMVNGMSLTRAHDFNKERRWAKIYLNDENDPIVEMDYNLRGGVSADNFNDTLDWWQLMMGEFISYIDF